MPGNCGTTGQTTVASVKIWRVSSANNPQFLTDKEWYDFLYLATQFCKIHPEN